MQHIDNFLLVDDEKVEHLICKMLIGRLYPGKTIFYFTEPLKALDYIKDNYSNSNVKTVLLLDLNMPLCSGWQFLEKLAPLGVQVVSQFKIYILSSSVDKHDIDKANNNPLIAGFITKPLREEWLVALLKDE